MPILQSSADMDSMRRKFWDLNLGGLLGITEPYRRFAPKRPYSTEYINPIKNQMPSWMPGEDYFTNFKTGDPYAKIAEGEYRLPGEGYGARFKELQDISPEKYPLIHKYKILADVAPYSKEFRKTRKELEKHDPTNYELKIFDETEKQLEEKRRKKQFRSEVYDQSILGRYGAALIDVARVNPLEHLTPLSPAHKLLPQTTAVRTYEESIYGKEFKLWQRPVDDYITPFATTLQNLVGIDRIPQQVQEARKIEEYFDKIKYVKFKKLEREALDTGSERKAKHYQNESSRTLAGADVYSSSFRLTSALQKREKVYFEEFKEAKPEDREKILELVPNNMRDLYIAQWDKQVLKQSESSTLSEGEKEELEKEVFNRMTSIRSRRKAEMNAIESSSFLPDTDWIGWRADVDLEDVKLKYLMQTGRDYHYYDLWDDRLRTLRRKPYLEDAMTEISPLANLANPLTYEQVYKEALAAGIKNPQIVSRNGQGSVAYDLEYERESEMNNMLRQMEKII